MSKVRIMGTLISVGKYQEFINEILAWATERKPHSVCFVNVHMLMEAYRSRSFAEVVTGASLAAPDGKPVAWALRVCHKIKQERIAGMDVLPELLKEASQRGLSVYFYGGTEELLTRTKKHLSLHYPLLRIAGLYSPPFRPLTEKEEKSIIEDIDRSGANMVFVVLGCPKQEKWMNRASANINAVLLAVGGALPVLVGMQKRAPKWMQNNGLEWLYRLMLEPKRLFKRYAVTNTMFLYLLVKEYFQIRSARKNYSIYKSAQ